VNVRLDLPDAVDELVERVTERVLTRLAPAQPESEFLNAQRRPRSLDAAGSASTTWCQMGPSSGTTRGRACSRSARISLPTCCSRRRDRASGQAVRGDERTPDARVNRARRAQPRAAPSECARRRLDAPARTRQPGSPPASEPRSTDAQEVRHQRAPPAQTTHDQQRERPRHPVRRRGPWSSWMSSCSPCRSRPTRGRTSRPHAWPPGGWSPTDRA
jgi:hypothetical protein